MLLNNKVAVIYGGAGSIGTTLCLAFAKAGATVHLAGRTLQTLEHLADAINQSGGKAIPASVNAMDERAVNQHLDTVLEQSGRVDISFNLIGIANKQNIPLTALDTNDYLQPLIDTAKTQFLTCTAAGRVMMKQRAGVILSLSATPGGVAYPGVAGFGAACAALENLSRNLAIELGAYGIRVVNIRSGGSPDSKPFEEAMQAMPEVMTEVLRKMKADTMLKDLPLKADIANAAVFLASDLASKITGTTIDLTVGTTGGLNYRTS